MTANPTKAEPLLTGRLPAPGEFRLLQAFENTQDLLTGRDEVATPAALGDWLAAHDLPNGNGAISPADHQYAIRVREAVRAFLSRDRGLPSEVEISLLDEVGRRARLHWKFGADGTIQLAANSRGVMGALGTILAPLLTAALAGNVQRLKTCRSCRWVFYDYSKNRSGTWCSMAVCGSRAKAKRHYWRTRQRDAGANPPERAGGSVGK